MPQDYFGAKATLATSSGDITIYRLDALEKAGLTKLARLPFSIRVLLEALLRQCNEREITRQDVANLAGWQPVVEQRPVMPFRPARVIMQDFTGVPAVVDLAAMRNAVARLGGDPKKVNPLVPVDLVIDHSVQVDFFATPDALERNAELEFERNRERYEFLHWGQKAFDNFRVVPPATGIVHQVNLEYLAKVVLAKDGVAYPDTLVGTDSHTTMINGLGVVGWGVGGIEAEAAMLGQPIDMLTPDVVGFRLSGRLQEGITATDLTLTVVQMLRAKGVVGKFVEFFGPGLETLTLPDRATLANMAPEYGATTGFFPVDQETLRYLRLSGRTGEEIARVEAYCRTQHLFRTPATPDPEFTATLELDMSTVEASLAGPKRPQDRVALRSVKADFHKTLTTPKAQRGFELAPEALEKTAVLGTNGNPIQMGHGAVIIAAITSCTNTSNPSVMLGAGLVAKKAVEKGLTVKPYVKTSLAPGSRVVTEYLEQAGLVEPLAALGFDVVGYGCTTCIAAGTPILLADGTAQRIEQMPDAGGRVVLAPAPDGRLGLAVQAEMIVQGMRDCVSLVLPDGRELVCTPDHEILCADGRWVRADQLVPGQDRAVVGLEAPLDEPQADESGYVLNAGDMKFTLDTPHERLRALAFARLVGHLSSDGSISLAGQGRMNVGQAMDREVVVNDIELITGKRPAATQYDERKWAVVLPKELTDAVRALSGVRIGRRIQQPPALPAFVLDKRCPAAVVREFLGGVFGADGQAPVLHRMSERETDAVLGAPAYSQAARPEHVRQLKDMMRAMLRLLSRCGVKTAGARVDEYPVRRSASSYPVAGDGVPRVEVRLKLPDGLSFIEKVGFRYCMDKALRASAAAVYWRMVDRINQQRLSMTARLEAIHQARPELSFSRARLLAAAEFERQEAIVFPHYSLLEGHDRFDRLPKPEARKFQPLHRDNCGFPSPVELFQQLGVRDWFAPLEARDETDNAKRYCLEKTALTLPTFSLQVLDRRPAGERPVFDLAVNDRHAFVAGGVCAHNCIGNSGPLPGEVVKAITSADLVAAAVLSGNRNFEGRIHPYSLANYLASPPLVVAYALAGTVDIDLSTEPLGTGADGQPVYLRDIWPTTGEIQEAIAQAVRPEMFAERYANVFTGNPTWNAIPSAANAQLYPWDEASTYIQNPPFFEELTPEVKPISGIRGARVLVKVGDSITTDHISPAGAIPANHPAGLYLQEKGVSVRNFNSFGSRRGNDRVMARGTFGNIRLKNHLAGGKEGPYTVHLPDGEETFIYDAAMRYKEEGVALLVLAGKEYGTGSSRDWAAKGTLLLGMKAVVAESFERIHRSNLVGMGVLPLEYLPGENAASLGLTGRELFDIALDDSLQPQSEVTVHAQKEDGGVVSFRARVRLDTPVEVDYYRNGGILHTVIRKML